MAKEIHLSLEYNAESFWSFWVAYWKLRAAVRRYPQARVLPPILNLPAVAAKAYPGGIRAIKQYRLVDDDMRDTLDVRLAVP